MKYLIVGASGFVGRHLFKHIQSLGYEVVGTQNEAKCSGLVSFNILKHRIGDCIESSFYNNNCQMYGVICVAQSRIDQCFLNKDISYQLNVEHTIRLIDDMKSLGIKPIFLSTDNVYNGLRGYYTEEDKVAPINEYGRQKVAVEKYFQSNVPDSVVLRLGKIVGDDPCEDHLFSEWYRCIKQNKEIVNIEGLLFSTTFVKDIARAIVLACQKGLSGIYNVANQEPISRMELAKQFLLTCAKDNVAVISRSQKEFNFADLRPEKIYLVSQIFIKATGMKFTPMKEVLKSFLENLESGNKQISQFK